MVAKTLDSELAHWADLLERLRWVGAVFDHDLRLVWVSPDLTRFLGFPPEDEIGYGRHVMEALRSDAWGQIATPESKADFGVILDRLSSETPSLGALRWTRFRWLYGG